MFTSHDAVDMVVLKTVALQEATHQRERLCAAGVAATTSPAAPRVHSGHSIASSTVAEGGGRGAHPSPPTTAAVTTITRSAPSFTFQLPRAPAPAGGGSGGTAAPHSPAARTALEAALRRHEDALRAWADEPAKQSSSRGAAELLSSTSAAQQAGPPRHTPPPPPSRTGAPAGRTTTRASTAAVVSALLQPHCTVLAQGSMAGIGVPFKRGAAHSPPRAGTAGASATPTTSTAEAVGSPASSTSTPAEPCREEATTEPPSVGATSRHGAPLLPYQLPLRLRCSAAAALPLTSLRSPVSDVSSALPMSAPPAAAATARSAFLNAQAQRYAQWRNRQAAVLHALAPDMWGRALPPYAALDGHPCVMDGGLRTHASRVRRARQDSGVILL
ncbi:hypothetical protein NESM_000309100 [Novymonas esmeraldas]|uniref:Uncharacterized protein n=1 Tax=Novymonas esmeraldas TaxID=1808958 RepID=A0AAW0EKQ0_9TRYP